MHNALQANTNIAQMQPKHCDIVVACNLLWGV